MGRRAAPPKVVRSPRGELYIRFTYKPMGALKGERVSIPANTDSEKVAERQKFVLMDEWIAQHPNGRETHALVATGDRSFSAAWDTWVDTLVEDAKVDGEPLSESYVDDSLKKHGRILGKSFATVDDVTVLGVERHKRARRAAGRHGTTLRHELQSLSLFCEWLVKRSIIAAAPAFDLPVRDDEESDCVSTEQMNRLLTVIPETIPRGRGAGKPCRPYFTFMRYQGLRTRTVEGLQWPDYNQATGEITIRPEIDKNKFGRTFKLFAETRAALDAIRPDIPGNGFIFGPGNRWAVIHAALAAAGLEGRSVSEKTLRHSRTTELCSMPNADVASVAYLLGWRNTRMLFEKYFHPSRRHADRFVDAIEGTGNSEPIVAPKSKRSR